MIELSERIAIAGIDGQGQPVVGHDQAVDIVGNRATGLDKDPRPSSYIFR